VVAVGFERGAADLAAHTDAEQRHQLVAQETHHRCGDDPAQVAQRLGGYQLLVRLPGCQRRAGHHHQHDKHPGQVLGAAKAIGVAARRRASPKHKGDPQWHGGERIGEVMDGVGQQRRAAADQDDDQLEHCGGEQAGERDLQRPDAALAALQRGVGARAGMAMAVQEPAKQAAQTAGVLMVVVVILMIMVVVVVVGVVVVGVVVVGVVVVGVVVVGVSVVVMRMRARLVTLIAHHALLFDSHAWSYYSSTTALYQSVRDSA
jgi:hypothetical protein